MTAVVVTKVKVARAVAKMISARNIHKRFGDLEVLRGIDLNIDSRKLTTIVGPSGAGKTTLLQILGTLASPEQGGKVLYDGINVSEMNDKTLSNFRNENIGFVFQSHRLLPEFSIRENVAMPALISGLSRAKAFERADDILTQLGLKNRLHHRPAQLSGGECQRASVARALINNPKAVLADEPTGSLDSANRAALHKLFFELRDTIGMTFVVVTHDEGLAADSDTIVRMADGHIVDIINNN